ncbi:MAG: hypothetical protein FJ096_00310 [Deltaproteobacteria bacterium]|nr:hypothetical protein [Deltaproteobacteria bacterium]
MGRFTILAGALLGAAACDRSPQPVATTPSASSTASSLGSASQAPAGAPSATSTATPPGAAAGAWSGAYDAKRVTIRLPADTPWPAWKKDGGKQLGAGTLQVDIDAMGEVRGRSTGALGPQIVTGRFEDGELRAALTPEDPAADGAMTGTLTGALRGTVVEAKLRVSSRTGHTVRGAELKLTRSTKR